jgi:hypothetical protein
LGPSNLVLSSSLGSADAACFVSPVVKDAIVKYFFYLCVSWKR